MGQALRESFELSAVVCVVDVSAHARLGLSAMPSASSDGVAVRPKGVEQVMDRGGGDGVGVCVRAHVRGGVHVRGCMHTRAFERVRVYVRG